VLGAVGYRLVEGWNWLDSFFMTLITVTTVGYGEVLPLDPGGKVTTQW
jgi:voltage-gated potassium channel